MGRGTLPRDGFCLSPGPSPIFLIVVALEGKKPHTDWGISQLCSQQSSVFPVIAVYYVISGNLKRS